MDSDGKLIFAVIAAVAVLVAIGIGATTSLEWHEQSMCFEHGGRVEKGDCVPLEKKP
jgi:hypothetical protein